MRNNILPLSKDTSVAIAGPMAEARFKTTYAVGQTPEMENSGLTISKGIAAVAAEGNENTAKAENKITINSDGNIIVLKSSKNGKYLVADEQGNLSASADTAEEASRFEAYSWGQGDGYSYKCVDDNENNGLWLKFAQDDDGNIEFGVTGTEQLDLKLTGRSATSYSNTLPSRISVADNEDGSVNILLDCYSNLFFGAEKAYYKNTRLLATAEDGTISYTEQIGNKQGEATLRGQTANQFTIETVQETGTMAISTGADYAVVIVGSPTRHSAGEGSDRSDLYLGKDQYELIENVSSTYPGKTIVIIDSVFPVIAENIQNNENVAAILYTPYGGEYDGYAVGQILYGDAVPTGKLTSTWYADMSAFPLLDDYSIPDGTSNTVDLDGLAPRYTVDISQADAAATGLTYQYTDAPVTYEFGYGLSYTEFEYGEFTVEQQEETPIVATFSVTNTGKRDSAEIVQLYASNPDSTYGDYAPKKRLVAFEKVALAAGETKTITLTVSPEDMTLWNSNTDSYEIEAGTYTFEIGASSQDIKGTAQLPIAGSDFDGLNISTPVSVYDKSFASSHLTYNEYSKAHTAQNLKDDVLVGGYSTVMSRTEGAWTALNGIQLDGITRLTASVAYAGEEKHVSDNHDTGDNNYTDDNDYTGNNDYTDDNDYTNDNVTGIEVRLDSPDGKKIAEFTFGQTGINTYTVDAVEDYEIHEQAYADVETNLTTEVSGIHDVYLVFKKPGTQIYTIQGK